MTNLEYIPYDADKFETIVPQGAQAIMDKEVSLNLKQYLKDVANLGTSYCLVKGNECLGAGGVIHKHAGRAEVWVVLSEGAGKYMPYIHKKTLKFLNEQSKIYPRLETTVMVNFSQGHRWIDMLGFKACGLMECYDEYGNDHIAYERITR